MSDIKFNCPHCQQRLGVSEAVMGHTISCPNCTGHIRLPELPHPKPPQPPPAPTTGMRAIDSSVQQQNGDIKFSCPACEVHIVIAERAAGRQIPCQHCGKLILVPGTPPAPPAAETAAQPAQVDARLIPELIERIRGGDEQAVKAMIQFGEAAIPALVEGFRENALDEPDTNRGADYVASLLVKFRGASVRPLIAKLGKSRHAYLALGRIGTEEAIHALVTELSSCNWRRVEVACLALGLVDSSNALKALDPIAKALKSTRSGEVYKAAGAAITAIRNRFPQDVEQTNLSLKEKVAQSRITPLKAIPLR
jgi:transcription elongation factor Elf1